MWKQVVEVCVKFDVPRSERKWWLRGCILRSCNNRVFRPKSCLSQCRKENVTSQQARARSLALCTGAG